MMPDWEIKCFEELKDEHIELIHHFEQQIFPKPFDIAKIRQKLSDKKSLLLVAYVGQMPVGFKLGYSLKDSVFYSWLGGVLPNFRKIGLAKALMHIQHQKIEAMGFKTVQTKTKNSFQEMLILNIKTGFSIIEVYQDPRESEPTLVLEKKL